VPLKSITIADPNAIVEEPEEQESEPVLGGSEFILDTPIHDTGSKWYTFGSFLLPVVGLIAGWIFKRKKHIRNYKACKRGAIAGLLTLGTVVALFLLLLLRALL
jgi:oligopeptide transport system ATP-binding protein